MIPEQKNKHHLHIELTAEQYQLLCRQAEECGLTKRAFLARLIEGRPVKARPVQEIRALRTEIHHIGNNINQLAVKANALGFIDAPMLKAEALRWHKFQADIEAVFLRPGQSNLKWQ